MKARSVVVGVAAAGAILVGGAASASANIAWCVSDPPAKAVTPAGTNLTVNTSVAVLKPEVHYLTSFRSDTSTAPDGNGGTLITVTVYVPAGISSARVTSSVYRYKASASAIVGSGGVVTLYLDVPTT